MKDLLSIAYKNSISEQKNAIITIMAYEARKNNIKYIFNNIS